MQFAVALRPSSELKRASALLVVSHATSQTSRIKDEREREREGSPLTSSQRRALVIIKVKRVAFGWRSS